MNVDVCQLLAIFMLQTVGKCFCAKTLLKGNLCFKRIGSNIESQWTTEENICLYIASVYIVAVHSLGGLACVSNNAKKYDTLITYCLAYYLQQLVYVFVYQLSFNTFKKRFHFGYSGDRCTDFLLPQMCEGGGGLAIRNLFLKESRQNVYTGQRIQITCETVINKRIIFKA